MNEIRNSVITVIIISVLFLSGCALGVRRPFLTYTPILPPSGKNNITIKVVPFKDERKIKDTVGYVRNACGMRMAKVVPQNDVIEWVTNSLELELKNAGYTISEEENTPNVIEGSVFNILCDTYFTYDGRIALKVILKKDQKVVLENDYSVKRGGGVNLAASSGAFAKTLEMALQETLKQVVNDINEKLLKQ
ncbi:MAG: hypothetical protein J7K37_03735 [Candidatus Omnitrophica bacterium]|nr:hypothetical protein [Candidatus Omnitrophota bacterium]